MTLHPPVVVRGPSPRAYNLNPANPAAPKGKPGRKGKLLNPATLAKLCEAIKMGSTIELACKYAGIGHRTYYDSLAKANAGDPKWASLLTDVESAEGAGAIQLLDVIRQSAVAGNWTAAAWVLERRYPMMYGRSESRFREQAEPVQPYQTREELIAALAAIPADVLADALSARKQP